MDHPENDAQYAGLAVNKGIEQPPIVNPYLKKMRTAKRRSFLTASEYVEGIRERRHRASSARPITLVESANRHEHQAVAHRKSINNVCPPACDGRCGWVSRAYREPARALSIDSFGLHVLTRPVDIKSAVLAIDPSSERSKGSILGDKTRMEELCLMTPQRLTSGLPPSAGSLGGVARKTREAIDPL